MSTDNQDIIALSIEVADLRRQVARLFRLLGQDREPAENDRSISGFCRRQGISRAHYYNLKKAGKGPREMAAGSRRTISPQAEADWEAVREAEARNGRDAKPSKRQREREAAALADGGGG